MGEYVCSLSLTGIVATEQSKLASKQLEDSCKSDTATHCRLGGSLLAGSRRCSPADRSELVGGRCCPREGVRARESGGRGTLRMSVVCFFREGCDQVLARLMNEHSSTHSMASQALHAVADLACSCATGITSAQPAEDGLLIPSAPRPLTVKKVDNDRVLSIAILFPDHIGSDYFRQLLQRRFPSRRGLDRWRWSKDEVQVFVQAVQKTEEAFVSVLLRLVGVLRRPASQRFLKSRQRKSSSASDGTPIGRANSLGDTPARASGIPHSRRPCIALQTSVRMLERQPGSNRERSAVVPHLGEFTTRAQPIRGIDLPEVIVV